MDIHQCPRCELRFVHTSELRHHFAVDHGADPETFERYRYRPPAAGPETTILLVANQTLDRDEVIDEVARRATEAGAQLLVLAPATVSEPGDDRTGRSLARWRVDAAVSRLRSAGVAEVEGHVGDDDPFGAVCELLAAEHVDEIVLSTLPAGSSRWLQADLPGRLRRHTRPSITVLTPAPIGASAATDVTS